VALGTFRRRTGPSGRRTAPFRIRATLKINRGSALKIAPTGDEPSVLFLMIWRSMIKPALHEHLLATCFFLGSIGVSSLLFSKKLFHHSTTKTTWFSFGEMYVERFPFVRAGPLSASFSVPRDLGGRWFRLVPGTSASGLLDSPMWPNGGGTPKGEGLYPGPIRLRQPNTGGAKGVKPGQGPLPLRFHRSPLCFRHGEKFAHTNAPRTWAAKNPTAALAG